ncbi:MAG: ATP-dependent DNA helicase RecG, partial [Dehalococcoidia bacterium]
RRRFDDGAVGGGLDAFLRGALAQAEPQSPLFAVVAALPRAGYASLAPRDRAAWARRARTQLQGGSTRTRLAAGETGEGRARRAGTRPAAAPSGRTRRARAGPADGLEAPVGTLSRIRATTVERLARVGVQTVRDVLWYFPHRHADFTNVKPIAALVAGESATVVGQVKKSRVAFIGRRMRGTEVTIEDESGRIRALWFNQPYLAKQFREGSRLGLAGKVGAYRGRLQFDSPEWELLDDDGGGTHVGRYVPVYPLTQGLPGRTVRKLARAAIDRHLASVAESLPAEVLEETGYLGEQEAIRQLHFPESFELRDAARERLAFQELLAIQLAVLRRKREARARADAPVIHMKGDFLQQFTDALPFQLTNAQMRAITQIRTDLAQAEPMARLLQGDVGSGKTVVAAAAMLGAVAAGQQAVLMAPTEILAEQHYQTFNRIFGGDPSGSVFHDYTVAPALGRPVRMARLSGSATATRKRQIQKAIQAGELDIVVGTHALIEERVGFERLGLAVVDEQHRFGVMQRDALRGKGGSPHLLVMTATPIPRTLALTIYGDLDVSRLDEMPPGRLPVATTFAAPDQRDEVYGRVREEIAKGRQVFFICPLVEESEAVEAKAAVQEFERLRANVFPDLQERMRLLHGRLPPAEKDPAMQDFRERRADILVSTAVIEVGVDVPNATVIVIEGADRFGLAQLHQFRGRVGRGAEQSYCFLLSESDSESARERLSLMESTSDGFELAEADLKMRGPGEYFGTRQSGLPDLRVAKLTDHDLLLKARNYAERILDRDPNLRAPEHRSLAQRASLLAVEGADARH